MLPAKFIKFSWNAFHLWDFHISITTYLQLTKVSVFLELHRNVIVFINCPSWYVFFLPKKTKALLYTFLWIYNVFFFSLNIINFHYLWSCHNMGSNFTFCLRNRVWLLLKKSNPSNIVGVINFINTICQKSTCNIDIGTIAIYTIMNISMKFHPVFDGVFISLYVMQNVFTYLRKNNSTR